jgi:hypothetical protein
VIHDGGDAAALDATELRLREGGKCGGAASACMKQGGDVSRSDVCSVRRSFCVKEMRCVEMPVKERRLRREGIRTHSWAVYWAGPTILFTFAFFWFFFFPFSLFLSYSLLLFCHFLEW